MVSSTHWLASAAGMARLEAGGNAVDAAVTAGFALQVVEPHLNGPGGDLPLIFAGPAQAPTVLCAQGTAPAAATVAHYRGLGLDLIPGIGPARRGGARRRRRLATLLRDHGTATLREVLAPAIQYAATGRAGAAADRGHRRHGRRPVPYRVADLGRSCYLDGGPPAARPGVRATRRWPDLGRARGRGGRRRPGGPDRARAGQPGTPASSPRRSTRSPGSRCGTPPVSGTPECSPADDLAGWRPTYEPPVTLDFRGWTVCKTGPWGQGPVLLAAAGDARRVRPAAVRSAPPSRRTAVIEVAQARLRRPGGLVRRRPRTCRSTTLLVPEYAADAAGARSAPRRPRAASRQPRWTRAAAAGRRGTLRRPARRRPATSAM